MITPVLKDDALLADIKQAASDDHNCHLWWLGQSGFLLQWRQRHLLIDPYLSDSLTKKYAPTDKPHVRMTEQIIDPRRLDFIDVITSSHNHTDHLDAETLIPLMEVNPEVVIIVPKANCQFAADRLHVPVDRLAPVDDGMRVMAAGFTFHGIASAHDMVQRDDEGRCKFLGYVIEFGRWTIYHSGDTMLYDGLAVTLSSWNIHVAILPINGRVAKRRVAGNLWGHEAAELAKQIGAHMVVPCHYEMFEFNTETPDKFIGRAASLNQPYEVLKCGQRWSSSSL